MNVEGLKLKIFLALILTLSGIYLSSCSSEATVGSGDVVPVEIAVTDPEQDVYAVYAAILGSREISIVSDRTITGALAESNLNGLTSDLSKETIDAYREANKSRRLLTYSFPNKGKVVLLSDAEHKSIFTDVTRGWKEFGRLYEKADGLFTFSDVGFNRDRTEGLVSVARGCGSLCGEGHLYILDKRDGRWIIRSKKGLWIS